MALINLLAGMLSPAVRMTCGLVCNLPGSLGCEAGLSAQDISMFSCGEGCIVSTCGFYQPSPRLTLTLPKCGLFPKTVKATAGKCRVGLHQGTRLYGPLIQGLATFPSPQLM